MGKIEISKGNRRGSLGQIKRNKKNELKCNKRHFSSFFYLQETIEQKHFILFLSWLFVAFLAFAKSQ